MCLAFWPTRLPKAPPLERFLGWPQRPWQSSRQAVHWADFLSGSQTLFPAHLLTVLWPSHPVPQLRLYSPRCRSFQNKGGGVLGATFGYKAVCTCPGHHHNCLDHPPSCSDGLDCSQLSWDISAPSWSGAGVLIVLS